MARKSLFIIFIMYVFLCDAAMYDDEEIDPDFILRSDLMPSSILMIEGISDENKPWNTSQTNNDFQLNNEEFHSFNGSWFDAYSTMEFHRKMMNEYLCRKYVVEEIISEMQTPVLSRRVGRPFTKIDEKEKGKHRSSSNRKSMIDHNEVADEMLADPGSSNYRNWLSKTATLEDVYKHYDMAVTREADDDIDDTDYETGDFTGYAVPGTGSSNNAAGKNDFHQPLDNYYGHQHYPPIALYPALGVQNTDKHGGGDEEFHHVHFHSADHEKSSHGMALQDIFDIALTTIAFLSFGLFVLQVLMCITSNKSTMAMMTVPEVEVDGGDVVDEMRFRRDSPLKPHPYNDLARRILISIEAGVAANEDKGACLRWSLCDNNRFSRNLEDKQKFWIPVWGLGMSWLSSKFIQGTHSNAVILESLRACVLGIAQIDCSSMYSECDMRHLLESRRNTTSWKT